MPSMRDERAEPFSKWISLIKAGKIIEVLKEAKKTDVDGEQALECVVCISHHAYNDVQKDVPFNSEPSDIVELTQVLCSWVTGQPSLCDLRLISSLYHITYYFFKKGHLECVKKLYKIVLKCKQINLKIFETTGQKIHGNFNLLLRKIISNLLSTTSATQDISTIKEFFSLLLDIMVIDDTIENGSLYLEVLLQSSQILGKQDAKLAVFLISKGLSLFYKVGKFKDSDGSLEWMFKLYSCLFNYQLKISGYVSALCLVKSYIDGVKWKFKDNISHGKCFYLLCNTVKILFGKCADDTAMKNRLESVNKILAEFQRERQMDFVKEACLLIVLFMNNLQNPQKESSSYVITSCLELLLDMLLKIYNILKVFNTDICYIIYCLSSSFVLVPQDNIVLMKQCLTRIMDAETLLLQETQCMRSKGYAKADDMTKFVFARCANLIRNYHLASLTEEIITLSRPICKLICTLPSSLFDDKQNQNVVQCSFTYLIIALGSQQLYIVLEAIVAWLLACPQSSQKAFKLWGDMKHNAVCDGGSQFLDTTIWTIVTEGKSRLESEWLPCNVTPAELGDLLVEELRIYFLNRTLRGSPVMAAVEALEALNVDVVTQALGLIVAMDVAAVHSRYADQCNRFYSRSKRLLLQLRKQKLKINPVDFNICMGELLYAQFRYQLKSFRADCDSEMLRLSAMIKPTSPLIQELPESRPDPDDTCDVATHYSNLSLNKQQHVLADMNAAIGYWTEAYIQLENSQDTKFNLTVTLEHLQEAAFLLKLYYDDINENKLWCLLYNMAVLANNPDKIVIAVGERLIKGDVDQDAVDKAKLQLSRPELSEKVKSAFMLKRALYYLSGNKVLEGVELLKELENESIKNTGSIQYINYLQTLGNYQKLSLWTTYNDRFSYSPSYHFSFIKVLMYLVYISQEEKWSSFTEASHIQLNLLRVSQQLGEANWCLEQPREARGYLRSQLSVAQKLALPLRTAQLLLLLAWVDLSTGVVDDCAVKLEGLEELLDILGSPAQAYGCEPDSPITLNKVCVSEPAYLHHPTDCNCFACNCLMYQRLVLETLTLRATLCATSGHLVNALHCFKVAFRVEEHMEKSDDSKVKISRARMWIYFADVMGISNKVNEGLDANKKSWQCLTSVDEPNLLQHAAHQKASLQSRLTRRQYKPIKHRIVIPLHEVPTKIKTPPITKIPVPVKTPLSVHNCNITPIVRPVRRLIITSGAENTPPPKSPPKSKRHVKPQKNLISDTPQTALKLSKTAKHQFTIVDDDGNAVGKSSSKVCHNKIKTEVKTAAHSTKKKLFAPIHDGIQSPLESDGKFALSPERKSNRNHQIRTYVKSKAAKCVSSVIESKISTTSQCSKLKGGKENPDKDVFSFNALKEDLCKIVGENITAPKNISKKGSCSLITKKQTNTSCLIDDKKSTTEIDSDCSVVEGTPPEIQKRPLRNLRSRKATRSNKT